MSLRKISALVKNWQVGRCDVNRRSDVICDATGAGQHRSQPLGGRAPRLEHACLFMSYIHMMAFKKKTPHDCRCHRPCSTCRAPLQQQQPQSRCRASSRLWHQFTARQTSSAYARVRMPLCDVIQ